jgi:hypothetical protein
MKRHAVLLSLGAISMLAQAQVSSWQPDLTMQQTYQLHRASSADPTGANADFRRVAPGATETVLDADGPGAISHIWFTIADAEPYHLKRIVLRIYWDGEQTPSVEAPIGDSRAYHRDQRRQRTNPFSLLQHRLSDIRPSNPGRHFIFSCRIPAVAAEPRLD